MTCFNNVDCSNRSDRDDHCESDHFWQIVVRKTESFIHASLKQILYFTGVLFYVTTQRIEVNWGLFGR